MTSIPKIKKKGFLANAFEIAGLLLLVFLIRTVGFGLYQVPTGSMETTMLVGERFFAEKTSYLFRNPRHGEIIALNDPTYHYSDNTMQYFFQQYVWGPTNWTKRVIGCPGDTVRGTIEENKPIVYLKKSGTTEEKKLHEPYLNTYPIALIWNDDPKKIQANIERELKNLQQQKTNTMSINRIIDQKFGALTSLKSYVPDVPAQQQPFYRINKDHIVRNADGTLHISYPGTPKYQKDGGPIIRKGNSYWNGTDEFYIELGPDEYWCMGDNRVGSKDCRSFGPFKRSLIHARIVFRIWSIDSDAYFWIFDLIKHPVDFFTRIRWNRCLQWVY